jgi:4-hydroxy-3-polyprenylbenzoate decarboxylase
MSLAKYLFIVNKEDDPHLSCKNLVPFFEHFLSRVNWSRDLHFYTQTTIDTLDYSGEGLNSGSKLVLAANGKPVRTLTNSFNGKLPHPFQNSELVMKGVLCIDAEPYQSPERTSELVNILASANLVFDSIALIILCDEALFTAASISNFVWVTFTRSNPSTDVHGIGSFNKNKHWGCTGPLIIDARKKPHHAPELVKDPEVERRVDRLGEKGASLYGII